MELEYGTPAYIAVVTTGVIVVRMIPWRRIWYGAFYLIGRTAALLVMAHRAARDDVRWRDR